MLYPSIEWVSTIPTGAGFCPQPHLNDHPCFQPHDWVQNSQYYYISTKGSQQIAGRVLFMFVRACPPVFSTQMTWTAPTQSFPRERRPLCAHGAAHLSGRGGGAPERGRGGDRAGGGEPWFWDVSGLFTFHLLKNMLYFPLLGLKGTACLHQGHGWDAAKDGMRPNPGPL